LKKHLNPSTAISCIALFVALSGAAYAAGLAKNSVKTKNIANGAVTAAKIKSSSVNASKLANGSVIGSKIANGAVGSSKLAEASVRSTALGGGVVTTGKIKDLGVTEAKLGANSVTNSKISAGAVDTGKLGREAVTGEKISAALLAQLVKNVSYVVKETPLVNSETEGQTAIAECPAGKQAIGGGGRVIGAGVTKVALTQTFENTNVVTGKTTGWFVQAKPIAPETEKWGVEAHVVCAEL
jgi:hypothetical protein